MNKDTNKTPHWDLMLATVKEVATLDDGSVSQLEQEFLEEFGHLPTSDLIDYFTSMQGNRKKRATPQVIEQESQDTVDESVDREIKFANKIALESDATILLFRKSFEIAFSKKPTIELVAHFLKRLAYNRCNLNQEKTATNAIRTKFVQEFVTGKTPTILNFRREFEKKFKRPPSSKMIGFFLEMLSKK